MEAVAVSEDSISPTVFITYGSKSYLIDFRMSPSRVRNHKGCPMKLEIPKISEIGVGNIDVILLTNFDSYTALPYLFQSSEFRAKIYATIPTIDLGRIVLMSLSKALYRNNSSGKRLFPVFIDGAYFPIYSEHAVEECISRIIPVRYSEVLKIDKSTEVCAESSGYCLGGANWTIKTPGQKIVYISASSDAIFSPPLPFNHEPLMGADIMIAPNFPRNIKIPAEETLRTMASNILIALSNGGNVIVPVHPAGNVLELIPLLNVALSLAGYTDTPIHFVSSVAKRSLHSSSVVGEWMSAEYQSKMYDAKYPLIHSQLISDKLLYHHESPHEIFKYAKPYVVMAGYLDCAQGEAATFYELWGSDPASVMILTDSIDSCEFNSGKVIKTVRCSISSILSLPEIAERVNPKVLACIEVNDTSENISLLPKGAIPMSYFTPVKFPIDQGFINAAITERSLRLMEVKRSPTLNLSNQKLYSLMFTGSVVIPNNLKFLNPDTSFVLKVKGSHDNFDEDNRILNGDALVSKYTSQIAGGEVDCTNSTDKIITWAKGAHSAVIQNTEERHLKVTISSSCPQFIAKLKKVAEEFACGL